MKNLFKLSLILLIATSCKMAQYTAVKESQLRNYTESVTVDSIQNKWVYCHDADNYRIHLYNLPEGLELNSGDSLHLSKMIDPEGIEIIYDWDRINNTKILR